MFQNYILSNVQVRLLLFDREQTNQTDIQVSPSNQVYLGYLASTLRQTYQLQAHSLLFYYDHAQNAYQLLPQQTTIHIPLPSIVADNIITFKCESKLSDQLLANPPMVEQSRKTRNPQRGIEEAFLLTEKWRYFYRHGIEDQQGKKMKVNLDQSADMIGVPRKTLQDYYLLFRMGRNLQFNFTSLIRQKIGALRSFIRRKGKIKLSSQSFDEEEFFRLLRSQLYGMKEEDIFEVLERSSGSDQQMIFEQ